MTLLAMILIIVVLILVRARIRDANRIVNLQLKLAKVSSALDEYKAGRPTR